MTRLTLAVLLAGAPALAAPVPKDFKKPATDYYPLAVGVKREYARPDDPATVVQTRTITAVREEKGAKFFTLTFTGNVEQTCTLKATAEGVFMAEQDGEAYDPPYTVVRTDMKEGDKWEVSGGVGGTRTVGKPEKIAVPAGTFTAFPISVTRAEGRVADAVVWYADGVGLVRYDSDGSPVLVLTKYTAGK